MSAWLSNPLVQSAAIPFVVALFVAWLLRPHGGVLAGLGFAVAYGAAVYLIMGFQMMPLTSTRKVVLAGAGAVALGLAIEVLVREHRARLWLFATAGAAVALWLVWPLAMRREGAEFWVLTISSMAYAGWLLAGMDSLNSRPINTVIAALALGIGTGITAVLGASALLGQLGGAIAAAVGAYALLFLVKGEFRPGAVFTAPVAALSALVGLAAVTYAKLPWPALAALALIPLLARLPVPRNWGVFQKCLLVALYTFPAAIVAITMTWRVVGPPPL